jgi:hypothetical protein
MKTELMNMVGSVVLIAGLASSPAAWASNSPDVAKALAGSTALELPAKAANLVANASASDRQNVTASVIKTAVGINPAATVAIVSAVAGETPTVAPLAAVTAVTLQHKQLDRITKAAAVAASTEAPKIVAALIKEFPQDYGTIAISAAEGAPLAGREILAVVADYVPALQTSIQTATSHFSANDGNIPVQAILSQSFSQAVTSGAVVSSTVPTTYLSQAPVAANAAGTMRVQATLAQSTPAVTPTVPAATPSARLSAPKLSPPSFGPPFTIPGSSPTTYGMGSTMIEQPGGRNYSSP